MATVRAGNSRANGSEVEDLMVTVCDGVKENEAHNGLMYPRTGYGGHRLVQCLGS